MKATTKILCVTMNLIGFASALGQSTFWMTNYEPPVDAPIFDSDGVPLAGPRYLAELWGGRTPDSLEPAIDLNFTGGRLTVPFIVRGYFFSSHSAFVLSVLPGAPAWLQVRAWDGRLGNTYEAVVALGQGGYGASAVFIAQGGNPGTPTAPGLLIGLQSFSLLPEVPEPKAAWLLSLGLPWLFFHRRRKG